MEYTAPNGHIIDPKDTVKDLSVYLSSNRSWTPHIVNAAKGAQKMAAWVLSVFHDRSATEMLTLYKSMVRSNLEYCCPVWNTTKIGDIQLLENVERSFTRKIASCSDMSYRGGPGQAKKAELDVITAKTREILYCACMENTEWICSK